LLGTAAGAPLRAMAVLAAIWIGVRIISWNIPAEIGRYPDDPASQTAPYEVNGKTRWLATPPLVLPEENRQKSNPSRRYRSAPVGKRGTRVSPSVKLPASRMPSFPWQNIGDDRGFFLQTAFTRPAAVARRRVSTVVPLSNPSALRHSNRMAAYLWIYARGDSRIDQADVPVGGHSIANGQYGGSQAGAILSYRLSSRPVPEIAAYTRLSTALAPLSQQEVALGMRIRPVSSLPVALHAEQRFGIGSGVESGTAFFLTGGSGPDQIVEKFVLETYAQAGYVLGPHETYFFDGSAVLQHPVAELGPTKLAIGSGMWAGGQRDISRIDVGPRAALTVPLGTVSARIAVDWRLRVAGDARPESGAAITVSTGF